MQNKTLIKENEVKKGFSKIKKVLDIRNFIKKNYKSFPNFVILQIEINYKII